jgi:glycosyltransferase involved in cell wall biosynthesis
LHAEKWPIDHNAGKLLEGWTGWPDGKKFALVLTHDVETAEGLEKCMQLAEIEERLGFRSSFSFVAGDYPVPAAFRQNLIDRGFEIGVHGLHHDQNPFRSESIFKKQAIEINRYLKEWGSVGFRSPSMYHDLEMLHRLDIEYDASTFDTDPFEPQPDGMGTIFPFWVPNHDNQKGYVELPYTLPQDFLLFILMKERNIDIWKKKLDWVAQHGGMAMFITHPNYMSFNKALGYDKYPVKYYEEFLEYIKSRYEGQYWHTLPRDVARFWASKYAFQTPSSLNPCPSPLAPRPLPLTPLPSPQPIHACMLVYSFYESDNRVMRYAETLVKRGDLVDVVALRKDGQPFHEVLRGVNVYRIQGRVKNEKGQSSFLYRLIKFLIISSIFLTKQHLKKAYQVIHVNNIPDFLVFAALFPKLLGAKVILDIHDIVPELYAEMFNQTKNSFLFKSLVAVEKASCTFADHVIIANHIWYKLITTRSVAENKCSVVLNYPDENIFFKRPRQRQDDKFVMIYPGSLNRRQGVDIAVKALALIKDKIPLAEFHIYGTGTDMDYLKRLVLDLGLQDRVFLKGSLPIYEVAEMMANADMGIEPKRNEMFAGDAMSTKILEFMSLGIPVIASDTRVHKYYFDESVVLFFKSDDEQDLARCMLMLIEDASWRQKMLLNSQQFVQDYVWEQRKEEYLGLVDRMTQGAR